MDQLRIGDPPARQKDYYLNQQIPPVILLGLSSSSKGIKDSNSQMAKWPGTVTTFAFCHCVLCVFVVLA
jgi:hypothetical protein